MRRIAAAIAAISVVLGGFFYAAINTLCDDDYWPDWE